MGSTWNLKKQILCSKWAHFKKTWRILKALSRPCPLDSKLIRFGGFQNGAVCPCSLRGCKAVLCQSLRMSIYIFKKITLTLTSCTLQPFEVQRHAAPFWKPTSQINLEPRGQGHDSTFRMCQALLKWAHLLHKICFFEFHVGPTVLWDKFTCITL